MQLRSTLLISSRLSPRPPGKGKKRRRQGLSTCLPASCLFLLCIVVDLGDCGNLCSPRHLGGIRNRVQENKKNRRMLCKGLLIQATTVYPLGSCSLSLPRPSWLPQPHCSRISLSTLTINIHFYSPSVGEGFT